MAEIIAEKKSEKGAEGPKPDKRRRLRERPEDYRESSLSVTLVPEVDTSPQSLQEAGVKSPEEMLRKAEEIRELLCSRGFAAMTELLLVGMAGNGDDGAAEGGLADSLAGFYYRMCVPYGDRPCYQSISV